MRSKELSLINLKASGSTKELEKLIYNPTTLPKELLFNLRPLLEKMEFRFLLSTFHALYEL